MSNKKKPTKTDAKRIEEAINKQPLPNPKGKKFVKRIKENVKK